MTALLSRVAVQTRLRRGVATLWVILSLPVIIVLVLYAVEAGRIHLARQQLVTTLESAAMAAAKKCATTASTNTLLARQCADEFAMANLVLENSISIDLNWDPANLPAENASCDGELVMGELVEIEPTTKFDAGRLGSCGGKTGPNAVAFQTTSTDNWKTITLCDRSYNDMVVIGTVNYDANSPPMVVRIQNAVGNSFEFFVQNVNDNSPAADMDVHFLVVEEGVYTRAGHGMTMEATKYESTVTDENNSWVGENRGYRTTYANPIVLGQVLTYNDPAWSVFWSHRGDLQRADNSGLWTGKHVGEDPLATRAPETIGYVVLERGGGNLNGLDVFARRTSKSVHAIDDAPPYVFGFAATEPGTFAIASQSGMAGPNGSWAHLHDPNPIDPGRISLAVDEDQLRDLERNHTSEVVHFVTFGGPCVARAKVVRQINWYFSSIFGAVLPNPTVQGEAFAYFDCVDDCPKLLCVDSFICP